MTRTEIKSRLNAEAHWYALLTTAYIMAVVAISLGVTYAICLAMGDASWPAIQQFGLVGFMLTCFWAAPLMASWKFQSWLFDASAWLAK